MSLELTYSEMNDGGYSVAYDGRQIGEIKPYNTGRTSAMWGLRWEDGSGMTWATSLEEMKSSAEMMAIHHIENSQNTHNLNIAQPEAK